MGWFQSPISPKSPPSLSPSLFLIASCNHVIAIISGIQNARVSKENSMVLPGILEEYRPDKPLDLPLETPSPYSSKKNSARTRRRIQQNIPILESPTALGSVMSLDPDELNAKNEKRLRNLKTLGTWGVGLWRFCYGN